MALLLSASFGDLCRRSTTGDSAVGAVGNRAGAPGTVVAGAGAISGVVGAGGGGSGTTQGSTRGCFTTRGRTEPDTARSNSSRTVIPGRPGLRVHTKMANAIKIAVLPTDMMIRSTTGPASAGLGGCTTG